MDVKKKKKIGSLFISFTVFVILSIAFWFSRSREFSIKLWVPEKARFINLIAEKGYAPVEKVSVSGTAIFVPLKQYQERFSDSDQAMIVQEDGEVYYITKTDKETFVSIRQCLPLVLQSPLLIKKVTCVDSKGVATIFIARAWTEYTMLVVGLFIILSVGLTFINRRA